MAICCNRRGVWTEHLTRHISSCLHACLTKSHVTLAQGVLRVMSSMFDAPVCLISLRLSTLHSSQSLSSSTSSSWSSSSLSMWVGSERIPLCASANEESDSLVNNAPLTQEREDRAARKGKWSPRGTGMTVLTYPGMRPGNRQGWWERLIFRWNERQLTLDKTVGFRVWWHTQGLGELLLDQGWGPQKWLRGRYRLGHRPVVLFCYQCGETAQCTVRPSSGHWEGLCGMGPLKELSSGDDAHFGWKGGRPWVRLDVGRVRSESPKTISDQKMVGTHTLGKGQLCWATKQSRYRQHKSTSSPIQQCVLAKWINIQRPQTHGKRRLSGVQMPSISWIGPNRRRANGIRVDTFPRIHNITDPRWDSEKWCTKCSMNLCSSQVESSSCQCTMTLYVEIKKTKNYVLRILPLWQDMQKDSFTDIGHFYDLEQKRNGYRGEMMSLNTCCSTSVKADIPYSVEQVLCDEELCEEKKVENCLHTSVVTHKLLKWFFALLFPSISSLFTEQWRICVKNWPSRISDCLVSTEKTVAEDTP